MTEERPQVIVGVDTHADTHHVAVVTEYGKPIADQRFAATAAGYSEMLDFITSHGIVTAVGVEGTGSYGAELSRVLVKEELTVLEVNRPNRQHRRIRGKSDPLDAYQAAQSVLAERGISTPKTKDGPVECLRVLRTARTSAIKARTVAINQIRSLLVSAPETIRSKYRGLHTSAMIATLVRSRPSGHPADTGYITALTLKTLAIRYQSLRSEIASTDALLQEILDSYAPMLTELPGVGVEVATQLLVTVGDNPERINNEAQFAALTGTAPVPASSGKTNRHRLSRGGDRQANSALHHVVLSRMQSDHRTKDYVAKRTADGKSKRETMRCLKRYVAREIFRQIFNPVAAPDITDLRTVRKQLGVTLQQAAEQLSQWPSNLSRIERGIARNDHVAESYRQWLAQQQLSPNM
ncbi:IS110 family transposase [Arthrobacter sp. U41]|uniref:IS110 family transposase n=1 Tax=Arthrobacter sp. U41 TaxID=1849032 RepID=UPI0008595A6A|nr:IS110 family transposase [Arthrobacter sp. U41]AOT05396.1 transposase [Arthrobacter sp. U41]